MNELYIKPTGFEEEGKCSKCGKENLHKNGLCTSCYVESKYGEDAEGLQEELSNPRLSKEDKAGKYVVNSSELLISPKRGYLNKIYNKVRKIKRKDNNIDAT